MKAIVSVLAACGLVALLAVASGARWRCSGHYQDCWPNGWQQCEWHNPVVAAAEPARVDRPTPQPTSSPLPAPHSALPSVRQVSHTQTVEAASTSPAENAEAAVKPSGVLLPEVDSAAVRRRGDYVEHTTDIMAEADEQLFAALAAVPDDDNGKWFISVVTMQGCAPCKQLKAAWRVEPLLLAWANPTDSKTSWAHYNEYDRDDKSQEFRWANLQFRAFPTVILQPPRNGSYGDPHTVVYGKPYPGSPKRLAEEMRNAMKSYIDRLPRRAAIGQSLHGHAEGSADSKIGADPPWTPNPKNDPLGPYTPAPLDVPPATPSTPFAPSGGWLSFFSLALGALLGQVTHALPPLWRRIVQAAISSITAAAAAAQAKKPEE